MNPASIERGERWETGLEAVGKVSCGTHLCIFYETKKDLLDVLVPYFKAGLDNNELCIWVVSPPLTVEEAKHALRQALGDLGRHLAQGALEIRAHDQWYLHNGRCDPQRLLQIWCERLNQALAAGYAGLRASGDGGWVRKEDWIGFREYEEKLDGLVADKRRIILCTYPLTTTPGDQTFDVARIHQVAAARRRGRWEMIEIPELKQAKTEIKRLNDELERKVEERTKELAASNEALKSEIAERELAAEALKQADDRIQLIIDTIPAMVWSVRPDGSVDFLNQRWLDYTGLSFADAIENPTSIVYPEDLPEVTEKWRANMVAGEPYEDEMRLRRADGKYCWFLVRVAPLRDERGNIIKWFGSSIDIEDRKRAEDALRQSEFDLAEAQRVARIGSWTLDVATNAVRWSEELYRIFDVGKTAFGSTYEDFLSQVCPEDCTRVFEANAEARSSGKPFAVEYRIKTRSGRWKDIREVGFARKDSGGAVLGLFGTAQDITERKQAEKDLDEAYRQLKIRSRRRVKVQEEERRHLARELHDEVGQTLTAAKINLLTAMEELNGPKSKRIRETAAILERLLGQIRQISIDLRPSMLDDLGLVPALRSLLDQQGRRASVAVRFSARNIPQNLDSEIQTTCFRIAQEAITNAVRHANATQIAVDLGRENGNLRLQVRDNGRGFDPESTQVQTVGLGLVGIKERAALVDARAKIISSPNKGTTVEVSLPLTSSPERERREIGK